MVTPDENLTRQIDTTKVPQQLLMQLNQSQNYYNVTNNSANNAGANSAPNNGPSGPQIGVNNAITHPQREQLKG